MIFKFWFCNHKWKTHAKKEYRWEELNKKSYPMKEIYCETIEILVCENCGKIKQIKY